MIKQLLCTALVFISFTPLLAQGNGVVCIEVYNDINANGSLDEGEPGIEGISIFVVAAPASEMFPDPALTDLTGTYCFTELDYGQYTFAVEVPEGWVLSEGVSPFFTIDITEDSPTTNAYRLGVAPEMGVREQKDIASVVVYPNPVGDVANIILHNGQQNAQVRIYDVSGKMVATQDVTATTNTVNTSHLNSGMYLMQVQSAEGTKSIKLIKK